MAVCVARTSRARHGDFRCACLHGALKPLMVQACTGCCAQLCVLRAKVQVAVGMEAGLSMQGGSAGGSCRAAVSS